MKTIVSFFILIFSSYTVNFIRTQEQGDTKDEEPSEPLPFPSFSWNDQYSIHVIFPDHTEDNLHLRPADRVGGILVDCLFNGVFEREHDGSGVVSGCINDSIVHLTIYSIHLTGRTTFNWRYLGVTEELANPYAIIDNETEGGDDYDFEYDETNEEELRKRVRRGTFTYYDGEEEYYDLQSDGLPPPIPSDIILKVKLGFDESLLQQMNGNQSSAQSYCIIVATHGSIHMRHVSLGTRIHLQYVGAPELISGRTLRVDRPSLKQVQAVKKNETVPLIVFVKTDDSNVEMGVAWPGFLGGACNETKGAALVKWRSNPNKAAMTFSHENGHMTGLFHDFKEDWRVLTNSTCEGTGIMSNGATSIERPASWSECSSIRIRKWFPRHGHCLATAPACDDSTWSTPCTCGIGDASVACLSSQGHVYCWNKQFGNNPFQCLTRNDIGKALTTTRSGELNQEDESISARLMVVERIMLKQAQFIFDEETHRRNQEREMENLESRLKNQERLNGNQESRLTIQEREMANLESRLKNQERLNANQDRLNANQDKLISNLISQLDTERNAKQISSNKLKDLDDIKTKITDIGGKVSILQENVTNLLKRSDYCAYKESWTTDNSIIPYDKLTLSNKNNIPNADFNIKKGEFKAGIMGIYKVDVSLRMHSEKDSERYNYVHLRRNGVDVAEGYMTSYSELKSGNYISEIGGRSIMVHLDVGDTLSFYAKTIRYLGQITFCIHLVK